MTPALIPCVEHTFLLKNRSAHTQYVKRYFTEESAASPYNSSAASRVLAVRGEYNAGADNISKTSIFSYIDQRTRSIWSATLQKPA